MATRALQQKVSYLAWNTSTNAYVAGDASNHSLSWSKDGTRSATANAATETDATNLPGVYNCTMTATETDCIQGVLGGKSSTSNVILIPTMVAFDYLNTSAPATAGVPDVNVKNINNISASPVTTVKAVQGLTTADTIATYTGNTPQTGDAYSRLGAPAGASVSADIAAVEASVNALPTPPSAGAIASAVLTTQVTESYRANGDAPTVAQALCETLGHLGEASIVTTTKTVNKFDHTTQAETFTLNDPALPTAITRTS